MTTQYDLQNAADDRQAELEELCRVHELTLLEAMGISSAVNAWVTANIAAEYERKQNEEQS